MLTTEVFILAFWPGCVLLPWQRGWLKTRLNKCFLFIFIKSSRQICFIVCPLRFDIKSLLSTLSPEKRRSLTDVTFLYKVLNGNIDIDISRIIDFHSEADRFSLRSKDFLTLK